MGKPKLFKTKQNCWGEPVRVPNFMHNRQLETAMNDYAKTLEPKQTELTFSVTFADGSVLTETIERQTRTFTYKDYDGEEWEVEYSGKKWEESDCISTSWKKVVIEAWGLEGYETTKIVEVEYVGV